MQNGEPAPGLAPSVLLGLSPLSHPISASRTIKKTQKNSNLPKTKLWGTAEPHTGVSGVPGPSTMGTGQR